MAESLEEILDQATDPRNIGDNKIAAHAFASQVNKEFDGAQRAVKLIGLKIGSHQEPVTLQALNVLESCVQNCGQKFHQEIGKYRFLNELIKLLSPKYDGDITSQAVKDRMIKLMYGWHVGLPSEVKIAEAYKMLKQQGVIKKDPANPDSADAPPSKPRNMALEDEEKSLLLATLLKSTNPDDLQAANRLIKTMVKQEEERIEKFSKRAQELETVSNNVKLLSDMLIAYNSSMPDSDRETMKYLYESCMSMRTQLFRMASSSAEEKDDSLSEILSLSDDLTKAIDDYKVVVIQGGSPRTPRSPRVKDQTPKADSEASRQLPADSLLDLGLGFHNDASVHSDNQAEAVGAASASSFLDDQFKMLGLDDDSSLVTNGKAPPQASSNDQWGAFGSVPLGQPQQLQQQPQQLQQHPQQLQQHPQQMQFPGPYFPNNLPNQSGMYFNKPGPMAYQNMNMMSSGMNSNIRPVNSSAMTTGNVRTAQARPTEAKKYNDPLAFDVFSSFLKEEPQKSTVQDADEELKNPTETNAKSNLPTQNAAVQGLIDMSPEPEEKYEQFKDIDTLSTEGYFVPLEAIEPCSYSPITVMDVDGVKTILNIVKDKRDTANPNVIVAVLSTISTNVVAISDFKIEISVPKVMRIKLQPSSATILASFNPVLPPSAITQIILIANPSKETIRMQLRISFDAGTKRLSEIVTIDSLLVT